MSDIIQQEIWKPIKDFEGLYNVSLLGNVRSLNRTVSGNRSMMNIKGKLKKPTINKVGYFTDAAKAYKLEHNIL